MIFKNYIDVGEIRFQQIGIASKIFYLTMQFLQYDDLDTSWNSYHKIRFQEDMPRICDSKYSLQNVIEFIHI